MSGRFGGRDRFLKDHDRARELAASRLGGAIAPSESAWLDGHLAWCAPCRAVAAEYDSQRLSLRSLRLEPPTPPRDLWARTSARIDVERPSRRAAGPEARGQVRGRQPFPVAPLAGLLVVAIAIGASLLNGAPLVTQQGTGSPRPASAGPGATPFAVASREIPMIRRTADGTLVLQVQRVDELCPLGTETCGSTSSMVRREIGRIDAGAASEVLLSPTKSHLVVLDRSASSGGVYVVAMVDAPAPSPTPAATPPVEPTSDPTATPPPSGTPTSTPGDPATPTPTPTATAAPTSTPAPASSTPDATSSPTADPSTSEPPATEPVPTESELPSGPTSSPPVDVTPEPNGTIAIADDVILVGSAAGYAADGSAFAFTARPADGSHGPDVYVWDTAAARAFPVTDTHDVVFADWLGESLVVSRAATVGDGSAAIPSTSILDLESGAETPVDASASMWRPSVDPVARTGVWWEGRLTRDPSGFGWVPAAGRLVIGSWPAPGDAPATPTTPAATGSSPDAEPASSPPGTSTPRGVGPSRGRTLSTGPVTDWQVRWDETGSRLAVWIAGGVDPGIGLLSLYPIDPATGMIADGEAILRDSVAYEGFSLGSGRLAWAAPAPSGETVVEVLAWGENTLGQVRLTPGDKLVVVR